MSHWSKRDVSFVTMYEVYCENRVGMSPLGLLAMNILLMRGLDWNGSFGTNCMVGGNLYCEASVGMGPS